MEYICRVWKIFTRNSVYHKEKKGNMKKYGTMLGKKWKRIFVIIVIVLALLFAAGQVAISLILRPVSGQLSDQVYIEGKRAFYRNETYELWNRGILKKLPSADMGMGFDLRS